MSPRASVVMPVFDAETYLREAVESVLGQTLAELELIAVDDGSTDRSPGILEEYARADGRVRVLRQEHAGLAAALNLGCRAAEGPYVARMDADDVALPDRLEWQARFLDEHPEVAVVGGAFVFLNARGERLSTVAYPTVSGKIKRELERANCLAHPTVMFRKVAFDEVGGYRLANGEDYDLWLRIGERHELANLPEPVLLYRHHAEQFSVSAIEEQAAAALAVRAAARARRATGHDPLDGVHELTRELLDRLGISSAAVERAVAEDLLRWATVLGEMGDAGAAGALLEGAAERSGGQRREFEARLRLAQAKASARGGRLGRAVRLASGALARSPGLAAGELARALRRRGG